jgi:3-deoxy-D-manno-octulosonic-acid transferase
MRCLYSLFIFCYGGLIHLFSLFNSKASFWVSGRRGLFATLKNFKQTCDKPIVWVHCASLGEFEQGRPVLELMKKRDPSLAFVLTFFSPSGYEIRKNYAEADLVCYLPLDTPRNAKKFISILNPKTAIFVKYEYWFNYMHWLDRKGIPLYVVSAIFRPSQHFFKNWGGWFSRQLKKVNHFYVQNQTSCDLLKSIGINQYTLCGDTRFDRVFEISRSSKTFPRIDLFTSSKQNTMVVGSSWMPDEEMLKTLRQQNPTLKLIIAPHEITPSHINQIKALFEPFNVALYTTSSEEEISKATVLIIDTIGMLSQLYQYGAIAYIGGGFGTGIHNILEAAVYEIPVVFGPKYQKFDEAVSLLQLGGAFSVSTSDELNKVVENLLENKPFYNQTCSVCNQYVSQNLGATEIIVGELLNR